MDITLLTDKQIWGDDTGNGRLQIMERYGPKTGISDFAILLGGDVSTSGNKTIEGTRSSYVWTASPNRSLIRHGDVFTVNSKGAMAATQISDSSFGTRPVLPSSVAIELGLCNATPTRRIAGVEVVEYGQYPQTIAPEQISTDLERIFSKNQLRPTGKTYKFEQRARATEVFEEYEYQGKRYVRVQAKQDHYAPNTSVLSNDVTPQKDAAYWIEVQPIEWLRDPSGVCVARQALFSGIEFDNRRDERLDLKRYCGDFQNTRICKYLTETFAQDMLPQQQVGQEGWANRTQQAQQDRQEGFQLGS